MIDFLCFFNYNPKFRIFDAARLDFSFIGLYLYKKRMQNIEGNLL